MKAQDETPGDILQAAGVAFLDEEALRDWPPKPEDKDKTDLATEDAEATESTDSSGDSRSVSSVTSAAKNVSFLFFTAPWCKVSLEAARRFAKLFEELSDRAAFFQVDADRAPLGTERLGVRSVPAVVAFARGQETARRVGLAEDDELARFAEDAVKEAKAGEADEAGTDRDGPDADPAGRDEAQPTGSST